MKLDRYDIRILEALQEDGRLSMSKLADHIGLTPSPTWARVRKMQEAGLLRGCRGDIAVEDFVKLTQVLVLVALESHRAEDFRRFEQGVLRIPELAACWAVGGTVDYMLHVVVPSIDRYQELIEKALDSNLGIRQYWSHIVTKPIKRFGGIPVNLFLKPGQEI